MKLLLGLYKKCIISALDDKTYNSGYVRAIRSGKLREIPRVELLVGDLVLLQQGDMVPCDGIIVKLAHLRLDEEQVIVESGSTVTEGSWLCFATAVGSHLSFGRIMISLATEGSPTTDNLSANSPAHYCIRW